MITLTINPQDLCLQPIKITLILFNLTFSGANYNRISWFARVLPLREDSKVGSGMYLDYGEGKLML